MTSFDGYGLRTRASWNGASGNFKGTVTSVSCNGNTVIILAFPTLTGVECTRWIPPL